MKNFQELDAAYEKFLELDDGTRTKADLARTVGVSHRTIGNWRANGRPKRRVEGAYEDLPDDQKAERIRQTLEKASPEFLERLEKARLMIEDHASHQEIERTLHIDMSTLRKYFPGTAWTLDERIQFMTDVRNITKAKRGINSQTLMRAKKLFQDGHTIPEVARQVAVSEFTLRKYFPEYKMAREDSVHKANAVRYGRWSRNS